jgi:alkanesulfonate monooxygenase SsuD/methylene tetrahydromethanopterin reductase-like flavin-dependent oxidoreductase (luciferase family)
MHFDVFFSISRTPVRGETPSEAQMLRAFLDHAVAADELGYGCAWVAESHLSSEVQKRNRRPVVPHWQGEIGLNNDVFQLAARVFARTRRIEVGSAVMNLVCGGGPIAAAERVAAFASWHGLDPAETRRLRLGFSAGRFDFMNRAYGVDARDAAEEAAWPAYKGQMFRETCEVFLRLLRGETLNSGQTAEVVLTRAHFRSEEDWSRARDAWRALHGPERDGRLTFAKRWVFEDLKIVPEEWRRELVDLLVGSHDPALQEDLNRWLPVKVFNLSITAPAIIEDTHARMTRAFHPGGGPWRREYMPRTVMVFLNAEPGLDAARRRTAAREEAQEALAAYWTALEGTLDPAKIANATDNALVGDPAEIAEQIRARFHPDDRVMLWFDFFNHDSARVIRNLEAFSREVVPLLGS